MFNSRSSLFQMPVDRKALEASLVRFFAAHRFKPENSSQLIAWIFQMQVAAARMAPHMATLTRRDPVPAPGLGLDAVFSPPVLA